ncbi:MAG: formimidoylglutamate deiminase [bacterium]|nr:formimidoylglutamate deiminase [bacterium]MDE0600180.1 formimidoylglutamate deiminase [bacterium]
MTSYWCELAWLGGPNATQGVVIEVENGRISSVTSDQVAPPPGATALAGLTLPALANAHSHAFHRALRGRTHGERGTFWTWRDLMYRAASGLDPDNYYRLARATFAEMALAGIGVVGEFHYVHHRPGGGAYDDPNAMGVSLAAAARDSGIRLTLLDTLYLHGGFASDAPSGYAPLLAEQSRFSDGSAEAWAERVDDLAATFTGPTTAVGAAVHSVRAVDPTSIGVAARWAADHRAPLHVHVSEQLTENWECTAALGRTPIAVMADAGGLSPDTTLVHATYPSGEDISLAGEVGANCCLCPTTERDLADGIGPSDLLERAGARLCVGSDSHAVIDLFEETRAVELGQRVTRMERGVHSIEALAAMATRNGYRSLGWKGGGALTPGSLADFTTIGLDSVRLAGADADNALASAIFTATSADVHHLVVGGRPVVVGGKHVSVDVASELDSIISELMAS